LLLTTVAQSNPGSSFGAADAVAIIIAAATANVRREYESLIVIPPLTF
jgi:hypothetical protein